MKNIAVFFGGQSVEHDVSVITGVLTLNALKKGYSVLPIFIDRGGEWYFGENLLDVDFFKNINYKKLEKVTILPWCNRLYKIKGKKHIPICEISAVINCIHGERGEDGSLSGLLKLSGIPLASPDLLPSSLFMDKHATKIFLKGLKIPTLSYQTASSVEDGLEATKQLGYPLVVKPKSGGSSIGVSTAKNEKELKKGLYTALLYDEQVIIEPMLEDFIEINHAVYRSGNQIVSSYLEQPLGKSGVLSFDDKYSVGKRIFPAKLDKKLEEKIKKITEKIYSTLNMTGVIRIDYFVKDGKVWVNEVNTVPGSMAYYLYSNKTEDFLKMLDKLIKTAIERKEKDGTLIKEFKSGILNVTGSKGSKRLK